MFTINNILNAANYESLCNYSFVPSYGKLGSQEMFYNPGTIFCKTDFIDLLFETLSKHCKIEHNLITHHSDYPIDEVRFNKKPACIKKWFAINPTVKNDCLVPIPLGLKTHKDPYFEPQYMTEWFANNIERLRDKPKTKNIYCNWSITNTDRMKVIDCLKQTGVSFTHSYNKPFNEYIEEMSEHRFVISPPGNGIDCHRTWEALYVGCIPVVTKHSIYDGWNSLPILQVNNFNEITQKSLDKFTLQQFDLTKLSVKYWEMLL